VPNYVYAKRRTGVSITKGITTSKNMWITF
jgi:hypothetical protein